MEAACKVTLPTIRAQYDNRTSAPEQLSARSIGLCLRKILVKRAKYLVYNEFPQRSNRRMALVQVKKAEVHDAILSSAFDLFSNNGYTPTTVIQIARGANTTVSNLYSYFPSKLHILYALYEPWLERQLGELRRKVFRFRSPRRRLVKLLVGLWKDAVSIDRSFANCLIEALATCPANMRRSSNFLVRVETMVSDMLADILPADQWPAARRSAVAHIVWMAFDGFAINSRLGTDQDVEAMAEVFAGLILRDNPSAQKGGENAAFPILNIT